MKVVSLFFVFGVMGGSTLTGMESAANPAVMRQLTTYDAFTAACLAFYSKQGHDLKNGTECMEALTEEAARLYNKRDYLIGFDSVEPNIEIVDNYCRINLQKKNLDTIHTFQIHSPFTDEVTHLNIADNCLHMLRLHSIANKCKNLRVLNAEGNRIKTIIADDPIVIMGDRPTVSNLSLICFNRNNLTVKEIVPLISTNFPKLKEIEVKDNPAFLNSELRNADARIKDRIMRSKLILESDISITQYNNLDNTITTRYHTPTSIVLTIVASNQ